MSIKMLVDVFETSTEQKHELGIIVDDPRGGQGEKTIQDFLPVESATGGLSQQTLDIYRFSPDALFKYVRNGETNAFAGGEAVALLLSTTETTVTDEPAVVTRTVDTTRVLEGITISPIPAAGFGFVQIRGKVPAAPDGSAGFATALLRGGVRVDATTVQAGDFVRPGSTNPGMMVEFTLTTTFDAASSLHLLGRKVQCLRDSADLDSSTNTDVRAEVYIY
jgi:hypothetical protein